MHTLYGGAAVKETDRRCENEYQLSVAALMSNAADGLYQRIHEIRRTHQLSGETVIVCGSGNNGGDGYALALKMKEKGENIQVIAFAPPAAGEPSRYAIALARKGLEPALYANNTNVCDQWLKQAALIVDCIFGSSFDTSRPVYNTFFRVCGEINDASAFVLSADMPSGVSADDGSVALYHDIPCCVKADATVCFGLDKVGLHTYPGAEYAGDVLLEDIGIPPEAIPDNQKVFLLDEEVASYLPKRKLNTHKGSYGRAFLFCGSPSMTGAAVLSAKGALRAGVGLVSCAGVPAVIDVLRNHVLEPIFCTVGETMSGDMDALGACARMDELLPKQTAILAGCGIGNSIGYGKVLVHLMQKASCPFIIDADGLNMLASETGLSVLQNTAKRIPVMITPHPAEMARLMDATIQEVQSNRMAAAKVFARQSGCIVVLKGAGTVIADPEGRCAVNASGNPGMAKGGMGDLLAGFITGFAAQEIEPFKAACIGVYYHGKAGDIAKAVLGEYSLLPHGLETLLGKAIAHSFKA